MPKGKSTFRGGWDGIVVTPEGTEFVPKGVSLWEFGTTGDAKGKADDDYDKRTANPDGYDMAESTFIFVTPQSWEKADDWVAEKKKEGNNKTNVKSADNSEKKKVLEKKKDKKTDKGSSSGKNNEFENKKGERVKGIGANSANNKQASLKRKSEASGQIGPNKKIVK